MPVERREIRSRDEWLQWRMADVTASDIGAIMGLNPDRTCAKVWAEKTGLIGPGPQTEFLQYRECQEGAVLRWLKRYGRPSWEIVEAETYWRDGDIRMGCTPDAMAIDPERGGIGCVQIKTVRQDIFEADWMQPDGRIEIPLGYQLQTQAETTLTGAAWAVVATEVMGYGTGFFLVSEIDLSADAAARIKDVVVRFWADTTAGKVPKFDFDLDADVIAALYPKPVIKEPPLDLSTDNLLPELLVKRQRLKDTIKESEKLVDAADTEIKDKLGGHESATLPGWKISWKLQRRDERIMPASEFRVLRVTEEKGKTNGR
jgi:predicted phage-related endonuclease